MAALVQAAKTYDMTADEARRYRETGFIVREAVFDAAECAAIAADCETLLADLAARTDYKRVRSGTFTFDRLEDLETSVKWERGENEGEVRGLEPFAHLSESLNAWGLDRRLTAPCRVACEADEVVLFTEKLNMKRAGVGSRVELHQDYPYWSSFAPHAGRVVTAMLYLDDASRGNGCLEVAAGSHTRGQLPQRTDIEGFDRLQMQQDFFADAEMTALEGAAGTVIWFSAFLAHRSAPNRSDMNRRALLYSYQPAGFPHGRVLIRQEARERAAKGA